MKSMLVAGVPTQRGRRTALVVLVVPLVAVALFAAVTVAARDGRDVSVVRVNDTTPTLPSLPVDVPQPVDRSTLESGWYLTLAPKVFTTQNELLLQAARELTIEARNVGYAAKLINALASAGSCGEGGCVSGSPGIGYFILLKGPYAVPPWGRSDADLDAEFEWHQTTQQAEVADAARRGLTLEPALHFFSFS